MWCKLCRARVSISKPPHSTLPTHLVSLCLASCRRRHQTSQGEITVYYHIQREPIIYDPRWIILEYNLMAYVYVNSTFYSFTIGYYMRCTGGWMGQRGERGQCHSTTHFLTGLAPVSVLVSSEQCTLNINRHQEFWWSGHTGPCWP